MAFQLQSVATKKHLSTTGAIQDPFITACKQDGNYNTKCYSKLYSPMNAACIIPNLISAPPPVGSFPPPPPPPPAPRAAIFGHRI